MINMAFMPLYMWEMWDVTPVTDEHTDSRKVVQYSVWTESAIQVKKNFKGMLSGNIIFLLRTWNSLQTKLFFCPSPVQQEPPSQKVSYPFCYCHNCQNPRGPLSLKYVVLISGWNIPQPSWTFLADFWGVTASCPSLLAGDVPEGRLGKRPMDMRRGAIIWRITRKHAIFWNFE